MLNRGSRAKATLARRLHANRFEREQRWPVKYRVELHLLVRLHMFAERGQCRGHSERQLSFNERTKEALPAADSINLKCSDMRTFVQPRDGSLSWCRISAPQLTWHRPHIFMNEKISFSVQGSTSVYEVVFSRGDDISATCTCNAGQMGQHCKHRLNILAGNGAAIISENKALVSNVLAWLPGTKLASAFAEMINAEQAAEDAKKRLAGAKKAFARAMLPHE